MTCTGTSNATAALQCLAHVEAPLLHVQVLAEPLQTVMRKHAISEPYEKLKALTRGKQVDAAGVRDFVSGLELPNEVKEQMRAWAPASYIGNATEQARSVRQACDDLIHAPLQ